METPSTKYGTAKVQATSTKGGTGSFTTTEDQDSNTVS